MVYDFSPYVPLGLIRNGTLDRDMAQRLRGWPRARWIVSQDPAILSLAERAEMLESMRACMPWDARFLLVTTEPLKLAPTFASDAPPNVALFAHATTQAEANERLPALVACKAAIRGVFVQPRASLSLIPYLAALSWVIAVGSEAPMHPRWVERLRQECEMLSVPFYFDHWGDWVPNSEIVWRVPEGTEEAHVWFDRPKEDALPALVYRLGSKYRYQATVYDRWCKQMPLGWSVPRRHPETPFQVAHSYTWQAIEAFAASNASIGTVEQPKLASFVLKNNAGASLATFDRDGANWRCSALCDEVPCWATKLL